MSNSYQRSEYVPIVSVTEDAIATLYLDDLSSRYIGMKEEVTAYTQYFVTDATAGRPEFISEQFYRTVDLWWVICYYNDIIFPLSEITAGTELKIPEYNQLNFFLQKLAAQSSQQGQVIEV
jgi:hypothetical protein